MSTPILHSSNDNQNQTTFESIKHIDQDQNEFWYARELQIALGYPRFDSFKRLILKTITDFENLQIPFHNDVELLKIQQNNPNPKEDYKFSRFFCYKLAMLGNTTECILARTYFATQTRKQELMEEFLENQKRIENKDKLTTKRNELRAEVYQRGIDSGSKFADLEDHINLGLYQKRTKVIKEHKGIPDAKPLDNFTSSVELLAKSLSMEMTNINVKNKDLNGQNPINLEGKQNASSVRNTLTQRGIVPEDLPKLPDVKKIEKEQLKLNSK